MKKCNGRDTFCCIEEINKKEKYNGILWVSARSVALKSTHQNARDFM